VTRSSEETVPKCGVVQIQVSLQQDALVGGPVLGATRFSFYFSGFILQLHFVGLDAVSVRSCVLIIEQ
jgi:hypothetical protein